MTVRTIAGQLLVDCDACGEAVPHGHTVLREEFGRICWFCYTDECVEPGDEFEDDDEWDDDEWDDDHWYDE